jgi:hypothetical protein
MRAETFTVGVCIFHRSVYRFRFVKVTVSVFLTTHFASDPGIHVEISMLRVKLEYCISEHT